MAKSSIPMTATPCGACSLSSVPAWERFRSPHPLASDLQPSFWPRQSGRTTGSGVAHFGFPLRWLPKLVQGCQGSGLRCSLPVPGSSPEVSGMGGREQHCPKSGCFPPDCTARFLRRALLRFRPSPATQGSGFVDVLVAPPGQVHHRVQSVGGTDTASMQCGERLGTVASAQAVTSSSVQRDRRRVGRGNDPVKIFMASSPPCG